MSEFRKASNPPCNVWLNMSLPTSVKWQPSGRKRCGESVVISCLMIRPISNVWIMPCALRLILWRLWSIAFKSEFGRAYFHFNLGRMSDQTKIVDGKVAAIYFKSLLIILPIFWTVVFKTLLPPKWITIIDGCWCKPTHWSFCLKRSQVMPLWPFHWILTWSLSRFKFGCPRFMALRPAQSKRESPNIHISERRERCTM